jgi:hypothetical protein
LTWRVLSGGPSEREFKEAQKWMTRMYMVGFGGLLVHLGVKALRRYMR